MDQRKVNMLAREYCDATKRRFKPVILSHRMMPGLLEVRARVYLLLLMVVVLQLRAGWAGGHEAAFKRPLLTYPPRHSRTCTHTPHPITIPQGQEKMSKSDPNSAVFMEDSEMEVNAKIKKAYCPPLVTEGNPCLEYAQHIVLPWFGALKVARSEANGGDVEFKTADELRAAYASGALHPGARL
jgi:tyrosyl-tRNA synthetase